MADTKKTEVVGTPVVPADGPSMNEIQAQLDAMKAAFVAENNRLMVENAKLLSRVNGLERSAGTVGVTSVTHATCNVCGGDIDLDDGGCPKHPGEFVNHMGLGIGPRSGIVEPVLVKQSRSAAGN